MAGSYTHAQWRVEATALRNALRDVLLPGLEHMHAGLVKVEAGETQLATSRKWIALVSDLVIEGDAVLGDHDARLTDVGQAQAQAGGVREVAGEKRYSTE